MSPVSLQLTSTSTGTRPLPTSPTSSDASSKPPAPTRKSRRRRPSRCRKYTQSATRNPDRSLLRATLSLRWDPPHSHRNIGTACRSSTRTPTSRSRQRALGPVPSSESRILLDSSSHPRFDNSRRCRTSSSRTTQTAAHLPRLILATPLRRRLTTSSRLLRRPDSRPTLNTP